MSLRIKHPAADALIDVPLAIEAEGGAAIEPYVAEQCAARGLPWPPTPSDPSASTPTAPAPTPEG